MRIAPLGIAYCLTCLAQSPQEPSGLNAGKVAFDKGEYRRAIELFEPARSRNCRVNFFIGLARYRLGEPDEAIRSFQTAAECDSKFAGARVALGEAYAERGDTARAQQAFEAALQIEPRNADALRGACRIHLNAQSNDKVIPLLKTLIAVTGDDADAMSQLGAAYAATSRFPEAETQFRAALKVNASHLSALTGLANVLLKNGRRDEAVPLLERVAGSATSAYEPLFLLGSEYNSSGDSEKAVAALEKAITLAPDEPEVWYQLATAYRKLERAADQQRALQKFKLLKERSQQAKLAKTETARLVKAAGSLVERGDLPGAAEVLESALRNDKENDDLLFRAASVYFDLKAYVRARGLVKEAIRFAPSEWRYEYLRGLIEKSANQPAEARKALDTAVKLNPKAADAYNQLGALALHQGDVRAAIGHFRRASELVPDDSSYRLNLEAALAQTNKAP